MTEEYRLSMAVAALVAIIERLSPLACDLPKPEQEELADAMDVASFLLHGNIDEATVH